MAWPHDSNAVIEKHQKEMPVEPPVIPAHLNNLMTASIFPYRLHA